VIIAIGLYQGFTALDAIGPYEVLTYLPGAEVVICAEHTGLVDDHNDLVHLRVDATFADVPRPDVLLVPGGPVAAQYAADGHPIIAWIRQAHPHTAWTTSVCTGALLLGSNTILSPRSTPVPRRRRQNRSTTWRLRPSAIDSWSTLQTCVHIPRSLRLAEVPQCSGVFEDQVVGFGIAQAAVNPVEPESEPGLGNSLAGPGF
jgi:putative intracellular protease/amidase